MFAQRFLMTLLLAIWLAPWSVAQELPSSNDPPLAPFSQIPLYEPSPAAAPENEPIDSAKPAAQPAATRPVTLTVGNLGDPRAIVFEGAEVIAADELRAALTLDLPFQAAARPSNSLQDFLDTLEERLNEGYLHSGFRDVAVAAATHGDTIVVHINEGSQYTMGHIRLTGSDTIDETALQDWLKQAQQARNWYYGFGNDVLGIPSDDSCAMWIPGEPIDSRKFANERLNAAIEFALIELGFPYARFQLHLVPNEETKAVDLVIAVTDDREASIVDRIEFHGLNRDTREQLLAYLKLSEGVPFSATLMEQINKRLSFSCRYWRYNVLAQFSPKATDRYGEAREGVTLQIVLEEYSHASPLNEPLSPEDEVLRKTAEWINNLDSTHLENDLIFHGSAKSISEPSRPVDQATIAIGESGRIAADLQWSAADWIFNHGLIASSTRIELLDWIGREQFAFSAKGALKFKVEIEPTHDDGKYSQKLVLGAKMVPPSRQKPGRPLEIDTKAEPVAMVHLAHRAENLAIIRDGKLVVSSSESPMEIEFDAESGEFLSLQSKGEEDGYLHAFSVQRGQGEFDRVASLMRKRAADFPNRFDEAQPILSAARWFLSQFEKQQYVRNRAVLLQICQVESRIKQNAFFQDSLRRIRDYVKASNGADEALEQDGEQEFKIPIQSQGGGAEDDIGEILNKFVCALPYLADKLFERGSWPWTFAREFCFRYHVGGESGETREELNDRYRQEFVRLHHEKSMGPMAHLAIAEFYANDSEYVLPWIKYAVDNSLSDEAFLRDIKLLTDGDSGLAALCRSAVEHLWQLSPEDQANVLSALPEQARPPVEQLIQLCQEKPDLQPSAAIVIVLLDAWHDSLRDSVKAEFERIAAAALDNAEDAGTNRDAEIDAEIKAAATE